MKKLIIAMGFLAFSGAAIAQTTNGEEVQPRRKTEVKTNENPEEKQVKEKQKDNHGKK